MKRKILTVKGLVGRLKGLFGQFLCPVKGAVLAVLWEFYMSQLALRVKCVIA